jgi:hypothetical protein
MNDRPPASSWGVQQPSSFGQPPGPAYGWVPPWSPPPASSAGSVARPRWKGTVAVAAIVAGVVLGGIAVDRAIPEPSAGRVAVSSPVYVTAAPGWVQAGSPGEISNGIELQRSNALLIAEVVGTDYTGDASQLLASSEATFRQSAAQISFGEERDIDLNGKPASAVTFSALVAGDGGSGMIDGELVCLILPAGGHDYAVSIQVGVPQGYLSSVSDDVDAMAGSVGVGQ